LNKNETQIGCGWFLAIALFFLLLYTVVIAVAWNVGLYGAGIVDHKIGFWTAFGLAFVISILRSIFSAGRRNQ
jgi:hypothetical protein